MNDIVPMPGCGSCYHGGCNFDEICAEYLSEHPDRCPDRVPQNQPDTDKNSIVEPEPEPAAAEQAQSSDPVAENRTQVPPPVETKRSCSATPMIPGQPGIWALLVALFLGFSASVIRRQSR